MRIVGVISSANLNGNSATLAREALKAAAAEGAETTEILLAEWNLDFCQGCLRCMAEGKCHKPDDFERLRAILTEADGIILASPTFGAAVNARMKNMFDRLGMFEFFTASLGGKYFAGISTAASPRAAKKVAAKMAGMLAGGAMCRGYISGAVGAKARNEGIGSDAVAMANASALGRKLARDIRGGSKYPLQNLAGRLISSLATRPLFRKVAIQYRDGMMKGVYLNLHGRGII